MSDPMRVATLATSGHLRFVDRDRGVVTSRLHEESAWVDLRAWPPRLAPLADAWTRCAARGPEGRWAALVGWNAQRLLVEEPGGATVEVALPSKKVGFAAIGFVGDLLIAVPGPLADGNKSPSLRQAPAPCVARDQKLRPLALGADCASGDAWELCGVAPLSSGEALIVWGGRVMRLERDRLERALPFDLPRGHGNFGLSSVPVGDGFVCAAGHRLAHVRLGASAPSFPVAGLEDVVAVAPFGDEIVLTTVGPLRHHVVDPRTWAVRTLDTRAMGDVDFSVWRTSVGVVASSAAGDGLRRLT